MVFIVLYGLSWFCYVLLFSCLLLFCVVFNVLVMLYCYCCFLCSVLVVMFLLCLSVLIVCIVLYCC